MSVVLNIYIGKENLPKDKRLIFNPDNAIPLVIITGSQFQREVISIIEKGSYYDNKMFTDRFGGNLYYTSMSTGSKALFEVDFLTDYVINCVECGENALELLTHLDHGNVYLEYRDIDLPWDIDCPVCYNGIELPSISCMNDLLR